MRTNIHCRSTACVYVHRMYSAYRGTTISQCCKLRVYKKNFCCVVNYSLRLMFIFCVSFGRSLGYCNFILFRKPGTRAQGDGRPRRWVRRCMSPRRCCCRCWVAWSSATLLLPTLLPDQKAVALPDVATADEAPTIPTMTEGSDSGR